MSDCVSVGKSCTTEMSKDSIRSTIFCITSGFAMACISPVMTFINRSVAVEIMSGKAVVTLSINPTSPSERDCMASSLPLARPFNPSMMSSISGNKSDSMELPTMAIRFLSKSSWSPSAAPAFTASSDIIMPISVMLADKSSIYPFSCVKSGNNC